MKKSTQLIFAGVLLVALGTGVCGALWRQYGQKPASAGGADKAADRAVAGARKYLTLEKVIVMLRRKPGDTDSHYLSTDLVIATTEEQERQAKEHLPLLRSIAVKALSNYPLEQAQAMTVEQFAEQINRAFDASYAQEKRDKPFSEVMIGKLIIE